jgi:hypothetical protein
MPADAEKAAVAAPGLIPMSGATTMGSPVVIRRTVSNGCASSVPSRTKSTWPSAYSAPASACMRGTGGSPSSEAMYMRCAGNKPPVVDVARYKKCRPSGRNRGWRYSGLVGSGFVTGIGVPPPDDTRRSPVPGSPALKRMVPSLFHAPPNPGPPAPGKSPHHLWRRQWRRSLHMARVERRDREACRVLARAAVIIESFEAKSS